jgi:hypothetical protein
MAQFFEKIQAEDKGGSPPEFFSSHPNPENRTGRVDQEIDKLGGPPRGAKTDSREFQDIKRYVLSRPAPPGKQHLQADTGSDRRRSGTPSEWPSDRMKSFENSVLRIDYPDNWQTYGQGDAVTIAPRGGLVDDGKGNQALAYGVLVNIYEPHFDSPNQQRLQPEGYGQTSGMSLESATDQLIEELRHSNQRMRIIRTHEDIQVDGQRALSTYFSNDSPLGGRETNRLVTVQHPEGLLFLVFTAPDREFQGYESAFQRMLYSVRMQSDKNPSYGRSGNDPSYSGPGRMTWRGRVDGYVELRIQGNRVTSRERDGAPTVNEQVNFSSPLPRADVRVSVNKRNGRGQVSVIDQPNQSNNYTAIIKIDDDKGGADDYEIEVEWK